MDIKPSLRELTQEARENKPELTFSIEKILRWTSSRNSSRKGVDFPKQELNQRNVYDGDDNDDDEDEDENNHNGEDIDDDSVDVDDTNSISTDTQDEMKYYEQFPPDTDQGADLPKYQWLQCTRYHPPKLQRSKKKDGSKKRKLGRNPRVPFSQHQVLVLEDKFRRTHYLSSMDVAELSEALSLTETRVKIWFQNRRARERRDKDASQKKQQVAPAQKGFQPLSIPTVTWPMASLMTSANYVHYQQALDFRSRYLSPQE